LKFLKTVKIPKKGKFPWKFIVFGEHVNKIYTHHIKKEFYENLFFE
jgi:hypothetical protein